MATGPIGTNDGQSAVFDVKLRWRHGQSIHQTGFSVRRSGALLGTAQDLANYVDTQMSVQLRDLIPPADQYLGVDVVNPITKQGGTVEPANVFGTMANYTPGPSFIAAVLALKSDRRSRIGQGRMFLPCYNELFISGDDLTQEGRTQLGEFVTPLMQSFTDVVGPQPWLMVNWHRDLAAGRPTGNNPNTPAVPATWYDVISARLNLGVTSLRSRKAGVGS